ncbi:MAG: helix-turn-helix transcriptional regulator [Xenococcaceae cyanobacterium MO_188.B29]|nr:helix-turn-helix transcriptional regulator [Xenococcaceae cyanobacterium MO_188.B29]
MAVKVRRIVKLEIEIPDLGKRIKEAREADPRSVTKLAKIVGISRNYWYQLEAEAVLGGVAEDTIRKIEEVLNTDFGISFDD